jgi:dihydroneopterin aldolase/2-amino-4-hydroxy-6-hydroxymethyldihydropteridine diphosphokinase
MRFFGYHGVLPEERDRGQEFVVDVDLQADLGPAGRTDDLAATVDYRRVYELVREVVEGPPRRLLEAVAEAVAARLLDLEPVEAVRVRVRKPSVPLPGPVDSAAVEIVRRRQDVGRAPPHQSAGPQTPDSGHRTGSSVRRGAAETGPGSHSPVFLGLGSNMGDRVRLLEQALGALQASGRVQVVRRSALYETAPVGRTDQPSFLNMVAQVETDLPPEDLLALALEVERTLGRVRGERWGPRPIDIDILLYGDAVVDTPSLVIPHPEITRRRFVLEPLLEIAPHATLPDGRRLDQFLPQVYDQAVRRLAP